MPSTNTFHLAHWPDGTTTVKLTRYNEPITWAWRVLIQHADTIRSKAAAHVTHGFSKDRYAALRAATKHARAAARLAPIAQIAPTRTITRALEKPTTPPARK